MNFDPDKMELVILDRLTSLVLVLLEVELVILTVLDIMITDSLLFEDGFKMLNEGIGFVLLETSTLNNGVVSTNRELIIK